MPESLPHYAISLSHLGFQPGSPKPVTVCPDAATASALPDSMPCYLRPNGGLLPRHGTNAAGFSERFPNPYDTLTGALIEPVEGALFSARLERRQSRWGPVWQGDLSGFQERGAFQLETPHQVSVPFLIEPWIYQRLFRSYLSFLRNQRCGCEAPGVHPACHLDDGIREDGSPLPAAGGWHDAGDFRKWLAFTQYHVEALCGMLATAPAAFRDATRDEIQWGLGFFQRLIGPDGRVVEDVGGGDAPPGSGFSFERDWWLENHPGCYGDGRDNRWTDNLPASGDERRVRTAYNPLVQLAFVSTQAQAARLLDDALGASAGQLALRAWHHARATGHDGRTLFLAAELRAAIEIHETFPHAVAPAEVHQLFNQLATRQDRKDGGLTGYFMEAGAADGFRASAYNAEPVLACLRLLDAPAALAGHCRDDARDAVESYLDHYLLADAASNPFGLTPYGIYLDKPHPERQSFRDAGRGRGVRTFMHPFNRMGLVHGTSSVLAAHARALAWAARLWDRPRWRNHAEILIQWLFGHNTHNRTLFTGIGYNPPVPFSRHLPQIPDGALVGYIGRPDDTPYLGTGPIVRWNTQEYWSMPWAHALEAARLLDL